MADRDELHAALQGVDDHTQRLARTAGVVARLAPSYGITDLVVTGGTAVAIASHEDFATKDVDVVTAFGDRLGDLLADLGFLPVRAGQHTWIHQGLGVVVQSPASALPAHSAVDEVRVATGDVVRLWSATDLIVDRVAQAAVWHAGERLVQALALHAASETTFDTERGRRRAHDSGVSRELEAFLRLSEDPPETADAEDPVAVVARRFFELLDAEKPPG